MGVMFTAACNAVSLSCGCVSWDQWDEVSGRWVRRSWTCAGHEIAARGSAA